MNDHQKDEVIDFLMQVATLSFDDFNGVRHRSVAVDMISYVDRGLVRVSGSEYAWVNKRVTDIVGPAVASFIRQNPGVVSSAFSCATLAAQAIIRRHCMSAAEYEVFVGGFWQVGVVVPPHPSEVIMSE